MHVRFVDVAGVSTRCLVAGHAGSYPVLMLHGYGGTADVWARNIDALSDEFFIVAPDMIGCGFTDFADFGADPPQRAAVRHLRGLVDALAFGKFCAMGTSYGSLIAALLYFEMPDRIDKLVINGSGTCFNTDDQLVTSLNRVLATFTPLMADPSVAGCRSSMMKQCYDPAAVPEEILPVMATAYARPGMKAVWERGLRGLLDLTASRPYQILHRLEELAVDTLVVWGREDPGAVYESAVAAVRRMPRAALATFEKCGHKPMFEHADRFNDLMRQFLRQRKDRASARQNIA